MFLGLMEPDPLVRGSFADPDPSDLYVFGPPGSGSINQRYGMDPDPSHLAKKVRKTLIPTVLQLLFDFLSLENDVQWAHKV
jgi:hypothetical protein